MSIKNLTEEQIKKKKEYLKEYRQRPEVKNKAKQNYRKYCSQNPNYRKEMTEYAWARTLKVKYGISVKEYDNMFTQQDGQCEVCKNVQPHTKRFDVDHCHTTGRVRNLLCRRCNRAIGMFKDNPSLLENATNYLKKFTAALLIVGFMIPTSLQADCSQDLQVCRKDCKIVIEAANAALRAKDDQISAQSNAITDLTNSLRDTQSRLDKDNTALSAWYHNPLILIGLGLVVGGAGGVYLANH